LDFGVCSDKFEWSAPIHGVKITSDDYVPPELSGPSDKLGVFPCANESMRLLEYGAGLASTCEHMARKKLNLAKYGVGKRRSGNTLPNEPVSS